MLKRIGLLILSLTCIASGVVMAHGNKAHVMGTIAAIDNQHIEVKTKEGLTKSIRLTDKTVFQRNDEKMARGNLKVGDRVVVHATPDKKGTLTADEIHVGAVKANGQPRAKGGSNSSKEHTPGHSH